MICKSRELQYIKVQTLDKYCKFGGIKGDPSKKTHRFHPRDLILLNNHVQSQ